jgi:hypothetical protein
VEIRVQSRKEIHEEAGPNTIGYTHRLEGDPVFIAVKPKASTSLKLHEIYHGKYSPYLQDLSTDPYGKSQKMTAYKFALEELQAEEFSMQRRGKSQLNWNNIDLVVRSLTPHCTISEAFNGVVRALKEMDYSLDKGIRSHLWKIVKEEKKKEEVG